MEIMKHTLYLTADERPLFEALPKALKKKYTIEEEAQTSYETERQLRIRVGMTPISRYPGLAEACEKLHQGESVAYDWNGLPQQAWAEMFYTLGARGITIILRSMLQAGDVNDAASVEFIARLTVMRHELLRINTTVSSQFPQ